MQDGTNEQNKIIWLILFSIYFKCYNPFKIHHIQFIDFYCFMYYDLLLLTAWCSARCANDLGAVFFVFLFLCHKNWINASVFFSCSFSYNKFNIIGMLLLKSMHIEYIFSLWKWQKKKLWYFIENLANIISQYDRFSVQ